MKKVLIIFLFLTLLSYCHSQENKNRYAILDSLHVFEVNNHQLYSLLDLITTNLSDCIFFRLNRDFYYYISYNNKLNRIWIEVSSIEQPHTLYYFNKYPNNLKGTLTFKNHLVLITLHHPLKNDPKKELFKQTDSIIKVQYLLKELLPSVGMGYERILFSGLYDIKRFNIFVDQQYFCDQRHYYDYYVSEKDTWEDLSRKFQVSIDQLQTINGIKYDDLILKKGDLISGEYFIEDEKIQFYRIR